MFTAFFLDQKHAAPSLEDAMDWVADQAPRFGMTGPEAVERGCAQIFSE